MEERFNKIDSKLNKIEDHQIEIKADLRYHIKRTDLLESQVIPAIKFIDGLKFLGKLLALIALIYTIKSFI